MVSSVLRIAPGAEGVSIWSTELFGARDNYDDSDDKLARVRDFLARAFAVDEVESVELRRARAFGRIDYARATDPASVWKKLSRAIAQPGASGAASSVDTGLLHLDVPSDARLRVSRIGGALSTWRVRRQADNFLSLWHPILRNRRDLVFRLEEELAGIAGIEAFRASELLAGVSIRFDKALLTPERIARDLEKAWPRLLDGTEKPLPRTRLVRSLGLAGLSFTGQYLVPPLRPVAVAGVALNGLPNVIQAAKDLQRGEVGLAAQYSVGLGYMLRSGTPFGSSAIGVLMQTWPQLARRKYVRSRRRLIAAQHRRATWAHITTQGGAEVEAHVDELRGGDRVVVRSGETVPVSGVVESGSATVANGSLLGRAPLEELSKGDPIAAGAYVRSGEVTLRSTKDRSEHALSLRDLSAHLPASVLPTLPALQEAERIANRNAKPAIALSAATLGATRTLRPAQAVLRPDYATGPRLSAELSVLHGISDGLQRGVLFKNPAALDRLSGVRVYVIDDSVDRAAADGGSGLLAAIKAADPKAQLLYLSQQSAAEAKARALALGIERFQGGLTPEAKLEQLRGLGKQTAWIGDGSDASVAEAISASTVSISVAPLSAAAPDRADILVPQRGLAGVPEAIRVARAHRARIARDYRIVYFVNTLGVASGLFRRTTTSLQVGLLSNAGTALIYAQHARALDRLARHGEAQRARLRGPKAD